MRRFAVAGGALLAAAATLAADPGGPPDDPQPDAPRVELPQTIEKLWYRSGGKKREGYLTVTEQGLEFVASKRAFSIPIERVQMLSFGKMRGDVDTDWVVMAVGVAPPYDLIGFRDGKKWGFGGRTREVYLQLRAIFKHIGAAQFRVPDGTRAYEDPDHSVALAIPEDWHTYLESLVVIADRSASGTTILSEQRIRRIERDGRTVKAEDDFDLMDRILDGTSPGFFIDRREAARGMRCHRLPKPAQRRILEQAGRDLLFADGYTVIEPPAATPALVGGCRGLRVVGRSRAPDGSEVVLELHAAAVEGTLYRFGMRAKADRYDRHRAPYAAALATVKFGVALTE